MLQKRLDYGFNGYQVPFIPRAARSSRRRGPIQKRDVDKQMCAFDLLATVAGKLLLDGESSHNFEKEQTVNVEDVTMEEQQHDEDNQLKVDHCDQGSLGPTSLDLELGLPIQARQCDVKENPGPNHDASSALASVVTSSDCLEKDNSPDDKMDMNEDKSEFSSHSGKVEDGVKILFPSSEDPKFFDRRPPPLVGSDSSVKLSLGKDQDQYPSGSLSPCGDDKVVKLVTRDDDENSSGCTQPSTIKTTRLPTRIGDRRIRKLLASKYWRVDHKVKDGDHSDTELRCMCRSRRTVYKRQRSQRIYPFKKRKYFHYSSLSNADVDIRCKGVYNSSDKAMDMTSSAFGAVGHGVNGSSSCVPGQSTTFPTRETHVKLRIKSFRVPELFIDMPETATIGSLKRTVMEAVTALLGGGLRVGVLLQGKKVRDDNRTLLQSGISHGNKADSLGFSLEPNSSQPTLPVCSEDNSLLLSTDVPQPVSRCHATSTIIHEGSSHLSPNDHPVISLGNLIESDHDSAPSPAEISVEKGTVDSRALVALPEGSPEALAMVPPHQKCKRSEMAQRRIRRPFSVSEVEALVQAVEKLGTGRWRDVKLRAFENVKHRTYVDLKDKWKTLVHTAQIAPQQRRGEPVPQELLDRVLAAHAYWSQQQAKQQLKQPPDTCLLL